MDCVPRNNVPGSDWPLFIPIAGPFVAMGTSKDRPIYALAILGAGQIAGAALFVSGLAVRTPLKSDTRTRIFALDLPGRGRLEFLQQILIRTPVEKVSVFDH